MFSTFLLTATLALGQSGDNLEIKPGTHTYYARFDAGTTPSGSTFVGVKDKVTGQFFRSGEFRIIERWPDGSWRSVSFRVTNSSGKSRVGTVVIFRPRW